MDFKVIWSDEAILDLQDICTSIANDDPRAAEGMGRGILDHLRILASFPFIGPTYPRGACGPLREIVFRPYRIFYDVSEELRRVEILHVWPGARQDPKFQTAQPGGFGKGAVPAIGDLVPKRTEPLFSAWPRPIAVSPPSVVCPRDCHG